MKNVILNLKNNLRKRENLVRTHGNYIDKERRKRRKGRNEIETGNEKKQKDGLRRTSTDET